MRRDWASGIAARASRRRTGAARGRGADVVGVGGAPCATSSGRRPAGLVHPAISGLPGFLTQHGGLQSGLMIAQVTAAALTSEIKTRSHPASVDTIPTSANKEDHVSMSMHAALKAERALQLATYVISVELFFACQAIDLRKHIESSPPLIREHKMERDSLPHLVNYRAPAPDLEASADILLAAIREYATGTVVY